RVYTTVLTDLAFDDANVSLAVEGFPGIIVELT
ncbi:hypothetical protein Tco_0133165, partial [Tanacetum coccineum]